MLLKYQEDPTRLAGAPYAYQWLDPEVPGVLSGRLFRPPRFRSLCGVLLAASVQVIDADHVPDPLLAVHFVPSRAVGLTFAHPITGEKLSFSIPEPAKFE